MKHQKIFEIVCRAIYLYSHDLKDEVTDDYNLENLGIDALDWVEIELALEDELGLMEIDANEWDDIYDKGEMTLNKIAETIEKYKI